MGEVWWAKSSVLIEMSIRLSSREYVSKSCICNSGLRSEVWTLKRLTLPSSRHLNSGEFTNGAAVDGEQMEKIKAAEPQVTLL